VERGSIQNSAEWFLDSRLHGNDNALSKCHSRPGGNPAIIAVKRILADFPIDALNEKVIVGIVIFVNWHKLRKCIT